MSNRISRRDLIKGLGAAGVGGLVNSAHANPAETTTPSLAVSLRTDGEITSLSSTSEVFIPPRGRSFMKFSFDFPEPVVSFGEHRFGFLVFTAENTYAPDRDKLRATVNGDTMQITCSGFVWAGGQERANGALSATFTRSV